MILLGRSSSTGKVRRLIVVLCLAATNLSWNIKAMGGVDDPVMAGYDLVAYHSLDEKDDGIPGSKDYSLRHEDGYLYYFSNQQNLEAFQADPDRYLPQYGGFCAWGMAWEYPEDGWPWAMDHMG